MAKNTLDFIGVEMDLFKLLILGIILLAISLGTFYFIGIIS